MTSGTERMGLEIGKMNENELCAAARAGDSDAVEVLVSRYSRLVKTCARAYYLAGAYLHQPPYLFGRARCARAKA